MDSGTDISVRRTGRYLIAAGAVAVAFLSGYSFAASRTSVPHVIVQKAYGVPSTTLATDRPSPVGVIPSVSGRTRATSPVSVKKD